MAVTTVQAASCNDANLFICVEGGRRIGLEGRSMGRREKFCGENRWKDQKCFKYVGNRGNPTPVYITLDKPGANSQKTCWDALENILNQCTGDGTYEYNGAHYRMSWCTYIKPC
ncbi:hypothetical protein VNI00_006327 [Paramarasmius palmivorus]|uniref:Secreted protein n=1 Tax=Paramarasmius palmivorus TaxID=297713 RepID=A0AAW0D864_9AGAR